ncbi:MAG TPA: polysaccharide deacetylase family protein [Chloroflexia bacterium]|nr:polysaccharide deacetylase family protein [Chloroflexia bacterium]
MKSALKAAFFGAVYMARKLARPGGITILSYHSLDEHTTPLSVPPRLFEIHMATIAAERCPTFTMAQVAAHLATRRPFPPRAIAITFDDGFENVASVAAPIMARYGLRGTVYVISGMVGRITQWTDGEVELPPMPLLTWAQIKTLQAGGFEIGAHSVTHGFLTRCLQADLRRELRESKATLEGELGTQVTAFAYPQGDYDRRVVAETRLAGYTTATTVDQGRAGLNDDPLRLPRLLVSGNTTPAAMRAFTAPTIGPAYKLINFAIKRVMGKKLWPRRRPGEVQSSHTLPGTERV